MLDKASFLGQQTMLVKNFLRNQDHHQKQRQSFSISAFFLQVLQGFFSRLLNPNNLILGNLDYTNSNSEKNDIRASNGIKVAISKIVDLFKILTLCFFDCLAVSLSWFLTTKIYSQITPKFSNFYQVGGFNNHQLYIGSILVILAIFLASGLYSKTDKARSFRNVAQALSLSYLVLLSLVSITSEVEIFSPFLINYFLISWLNTLLFVSSERFLVFQLVVLTRGQFFPFKIKILLIGNKQDINKSQELLNNINVFRVSGKLDISDIHSDSNYEEIFDIVRHKKIDEIFICSWENIEEKIKLFWTLQASGVSWRILPINLKIPKKRPQITEIDGIPTIRFENTTIVSIDFWSKRVFDLIASSILITILGLPMLFIALLIKLDSPGPIFYKQTRVGLKGRHFQVWKFRTMVQNANQLQKELEAKNEIQGGILFKIKDDPRITLIGKYLRRYSLDEIPQLFNVLRGEMSLVGPRPLPVRDVTKFAEHHHFRHEVLPGITGLWQVNGRSNTDSDKVFDLDQTYIENWSLALDFKILLKTIQVVIFGKGSY